MAQVLDERVENRGARPLHEEAHIGARGRGEIEKLAAKLYDLLILDWTLPGLSGMDVCRQYRGNGGNAAIIILTGKNTINDKEEGFEAGADDYLTKPFHPRELSARIKALARRPGKS